MVDTVVTTAGLWKTGRMQLDATAVQVQIQVKTVIVQLLWVGVQLPTLNNTVEYQVFDFKQ